MAWYIAASLKQCPQNLGIVDPSFARRGTSDGALGDASHQARPSDHNPDYADGGVVRAIDVDVKVGVLAGLGMAVVAAAIAHESTQYVIHDGYIWNRKYGPFRRRVYNGSNPHRSHVHISIRHSRSAENSTAVWRNVLGQSTPAVESNAKPGERVLRLTDPQTNGADVRALQAWIGVQGDGYFGPATEAALKRVQATVGIKVDGIAGKDTWAHYQAWVTWMAARAAAAKAAAAAAAAKAAADLAARRNHAVSASLPRGYTWDHRTGYLSADRNGGRVHGGVRKVQAQLQARTFYTGALDGRFGPATERAVKQFQAAAGLTVDGVVGEKTWTALWTRRV